jgi:hypothetical protein
MAADVDEQTPESIESALRELVQTPGWQLLMAQADVEWGPTGYGRRMQEAIATIALGPDRAYQIADVAERVDATARAVTDILAWPKEQIRRLTAHEEPPRRFGAFRRGPSR